MKVTLINITNNNKTNDPFNLCATKLSELGYDTQTMDVIQTPEAIKTALDFVTDTAIIVGTNSCEDNFQLKKIISAYFGLPLVKDASILSSINLTDSDDYENIKKQLSYEIYLPQGSNFILSPTGLKQGFVLNGSKTVYFFPNQIDIISNNINNYFSMQPQNIPTKTSVIKLYGLSYDRVKSALDGVFKGDDLFSYQLSNVGLDFKIEVICPYNVNEFIVDEKLSQIYEVLGKFIYAAEDISLEDMFIELLNLTKKSIALCECVTCGNIVGKIVKKDKEFKKYIKECIIAFNKETLINRLNVSPLVFANKEESSVEICYEAAAGLVNLTGADLVVCNIGTMVNETKNTIYIAVGDADGIHVYENNFTGQYEDVINSITDITFYYLIKKIKQNDLYFN